MARQLNFYFHKLVVGSSLSALIYAYVNQLPFIYTVLEKPFKLDTIDPNFDLSGINLKFKARRHLCNEDLYYTGPRKTAVWDRLIFVLSLNGLNPIAKPLSSIKIEDHQTLKCLTANARLIEINFHNLIIFNDAGIQGLPNPKKVPDEKLFHVYDHIKVRHGAKHKYWSLLGDDELVKIIYFHIKEDMLFERRYFKDAVAYSILTEKQLHDPNYSDTIVKFKAHQMMKDVGIGAKTQLKIEIKKREIVPIYNNQYKSTFNLIFKKNDDDMYLKLLKKVNHTLKKYVDRLCTKVSVI